MTGSGRGTIRLWDTDTGKVHETRVKSSDWDFVSMIAFSCDSLTVASGRGSGTIQLWDVDTGEHRNTLSRTYDLGQQRFLQ